VESSSQYNKLSHTNQQGETVSTTGVTKPYKMKIKPGDEWKTWKTQVVMSMLSKEQLPRSLKHDGAKVLCEVESVLNDVEMKPKNQHWYNRKDKYLRANFDVKVILGAADLKFQLWSKGGRICSRDHDTIDVKWDPPEKVSEREDNMAAIYKG